MYLRKKEIGFYPCLPSALIRVLKRTMGPSGIKVIVNARVWMGATHEREMKEVDSEFGFRSWLNSFVLVFLVVRRRF